MSELPVHVLSVSQRFEDNADGSPQFLSDLLFYPEISSFTARPEKARERQLDIATELLKKRPPDEVQRRLLPEEAQPGTVQIEIAPSPRRHGNSWTAPVTLRLPLLRWRHGENAHIAYVPALGIEILAPDEERLEKRLPAEVYSAVAREGFVNSLLDLAYLQRGQELHLQGGDWNLWPKTPEEDHKSQMAGDQPEEKNLEAVATKLEPRKMATAFERDTTVRQLADLLGGRRRTSVLLVGPSGVGKTAIIGELVRRKSDFGLGGRVFFRSSGSRLVAGMCGFGMWQERCRKVAAEAAARRAVLHLGNLLELMEVGQSTASSESIASFLRPYMVRGQLVAVLECTPEQLSVIEKREPKLLDAFRKLPVMEPTPDESSRIFRAVESTRFTGAALTKADQLHRRYSSYSAYPGRPLRFLARLAGGQKPSADTPKLDTRAVLDAFSKESGMPPVLISDAHPLDLDKTRGWFRRRIVGQDVAVDLVVDTLATVKTALNRPGKPLASFLFIGPTGVGKTELAKVLAEFLYQSRDRLIRLDMSEYGSPLSAGRLVSESGIGGKEGLLTAKVREEPFSVILLDEFEKADHSVFDLFLQVLGEGRLTDGAGRVADFTNAVIIMTSNLGARDFQRGVTGFSTGGARDSVGHFTAAVKAAMRPELFNRIDRILPFLPLAREIIAQIIRRELAEAGARDGLGGRGIQLDIDPAVTDLITTAGHDPRYGARPLKRAIERLILTPAAEMIAATGHRDRAIRATVGKKSSIVLNWVAGRTSREASDTRATLHKKIGETSALRREYHRLTKSPPVSTLESEARRLDQQLRAEQRRRRKKIPSPNQPPTDRRRLKKINTLLDRLSDNTAALTAHEESLILQDMETTGGKEPRAELPDRAGFESLLIDLYLHSENGDPASTLFIISESKALKFVLAESYYKIAQDIGASPQLHRIDRKPAADKLVHLGDKEATYPQKINISKTAEIFSTRPDEIASLAIGLSGHGSSAWFDTEPGIHLFTSDEEHKDRALVALVSSAPESSAVFLQDLAHPRFKLFSVRRHFDATKPSFKDSLLGRRGRSLFSHELLADLVRQSLLKRALGAAQVD